MPLEKFQHISRFLSLLLAIFMLGLSFGLSAIPIINKLEVSEAKSIITVVLDIELDLSQKGLGAEDCSNEAECETPSDYFDIFHFSQAFNLDHFFLSSLHLNHAHLLSIKGRVMDNTSPPPQS